MNFERRGGISPIIATLLLIAIAVAAGIVVYVFVNGVAGGLTTGGGQQTTERLQMQSYNFVISPGTTCVCSAWLVELYLANTGSAATTVSSVYYDGALQTLTAATQTNTALASGTAYTASSTATLQDFTTTCSSTAGPADTICFTVAGAKTSYAVGDTGQVVVTFGAAQTAGTSHTIKVVSTTGATFVFSVTAGRTG